jgi:hypothetical protein
MDSDTLAIIKAVAESLETTKAANLAAADLAQKAAQNANHAQGRLSWQIVTQLGVWLVSILLAYGVINTRLQVLEVKYDRTTQDIQEMKADLKQVLSYWHKIDGPVLLPMDRNDAHKTP